MRASGPSSEVSPRSGPTDDPAHRPAEFPGGHARGSGHQAADGSAPSTQAREPGNVPVRTPASPRSRSARSAGARATASSSPTSTSSGSTRLRRAQPSPAACSAPPQNRTPGGRRTSRRATSRMRWTSVSGPVDAAKPGRGDAEPQHSLEALAVLKVDVDRHHRVQQGLGSRRGDPGGHLSRSAVQSSRKRGLPKADVLGGRRLVRVRGRLRDPDGPWGSGSHRSRVAGPPRPQPVGL